MIIYEKGSFNSRSLFRTRGSVFKATLPGAALCGLISGGLKIASFYYLPLADVLDNILANNSAYSSFSVLMGFLIIFRTQQSYGRFWDGSNYVKKMQAEYFVTASNLIAFSRQSTAEPHLVNQFQQVLVRLVSILHAVSLNQLRGQGDTVQQEIIDFSGIDRESIKTVWDEECKVELIVQWLQASTVDAQAAGVITIAPPILSRIFQNLSNGLSAFYSAYRVTEIPYPFPYMQTTETLLLCHLAVTPLVMCNFTSRSLWAGIFSFLVAFILLSLNKIAVELEDPYGDDDNDLDFSMLQREMNKRLLLLMRPSTSRVPKLSVHARLDSFDDKGPGKTSDLSHKSRLSGLCELVCLEGTTGGTFEMEPSSSTVHSDDCVPNGIPDLFLRRETQIKLVKAQTLMMQSSDDLGSLETLLADKQEDGHMTINVSECAPIVVEPGILGKRGGTATDGGGEHSLQAGIHPRRIVEPGVAPMPVAEVSIAGLQAQTRRQSASIGQRPAQGANSTSHAQRPEDTSRKSGKEVGPSAEAVCAPLKSPLPPEQQPLHHSRS